MYQPKKITTEEINQEISELSPLFEAHKDKLGLVDVGSEEHIALTKLLNKQKGRLDALKYMLREMDNRKTQEIEIKWRNAFRPGIWPYEVDNVTRDKRIKALIESGTDFNEKDHGGRTALHHAPEAMVAKLLIEHGADVHAIDKYGRTPLHGAHKPDHLMVLIEAGADVNARDNFGRTPLHYSSRERPYSVPVLIDAGADVDAVANDGTPAMTSYSDDIARRHLSKKMGAAIHEAMGGDLMLDMSAPGQSSDPPPL